MVGKGINVQEWKKYFPNWLNYMKFACCMIELSNKIIYLSCMELMRAELFMDDLSTPYTLYTSSGIVWYFSKSIIFSTYVQ